MEKTLRYEILIYHELITHMNSSVVIGTSLSSSDETTVEKKG